VRRVLNFAGRQSSGKRAAVGVIAAAVAVGLVACGSAAQKPTSQNAPATVGSPTLSPISTPTATVNGQIGTALAVTGNGAVAGAGGTGADSNGGDSSGGDGGGDSGGAADPATGGDSGTTDTSGAAGGPGPASAGSGAGPVGPPRVFMSMHGNNDLANNSSYDSQWSYVRANLDGIWGNNVDIDLATQLRMWRKLKTRNVISIDQVPVDPSGSFQAFGSNSIPEEQSSDIKLHREAIALYTHDPSDWVGHTVAQARSVHSSASVDYPYAKVYSGWGMRNFVPLGGASKNAAPLNTEAQTAFNQADGAFVECLLTQCTMGGGFTDGLTSVFKTMHAQNKPVVFFWSPGDSDLATFQSNYNSLKSRGLWHTNDIILVMNYGGNFKVAPETVNGQPANTVTGMLYWALKQK
jgi:hypothetical protein